MDIKQTRRLLREEKYTFLTRLETKRKKGEMELVIKSTPKGGKQQKNDNMNKNWNESRKRRYWSKGDKTED